MTNDALTVKITDIEESTTSTCMIAFFVMHSNMYIKYFRQKRCVTCEGYRMGNNVGT